MPVEVRALIVVTGESDDAVDEVLRDLAAKRDPLRELYVSIAETSRKLVDQ